MPNKNYWHLALPAVILLFTVSAVIAIITLFSFSSADSLSGESEPAGGQDVDPSPVPTATPAVLVGAGDIADCGENGDDETASLLDKIPGQIFTAGDNSNDQGSLEQYEDCFGPSWGRHLERIHPALGNHDYETDKGEDYYTYFGDAAGNPGEGYYSYDLGDWHIVVLNSNCKNNGNCEFSSPQVEWLKKDLEHHPGLCSLAVWHHPRWESDENDSEWLDPFWQILYQNGVELVVNGHEHYYERMEPKNTEGIADFERGIRQFIAGTGGAELVDFELTTDEEVVISNESWGVLKLSLFQDHYDWEFIPADEGGFTDSGSTPCHR